jgi:hypothetical protein
MMTFNERHLLFIKSRFALLESTLASHLAQVWRQNSNSVPAPGMMRDVLSCSILWQGDPFSCSKTFGKLSCKLCQKERVAMLWLSWTDGSKNNK